MTIRVRSASVGCRTSGPATVKSATLGESYQVRLGGAGGARTHDRRIMSPIRQQRLAGGLTWVNGSSRRPAQPHFGTYVA